MWLTILVSLGLILLLVTLLHKRGSQGDLDLIPGPTNNIYWDALFKARTDVSKNHVRLQALAKRYGNMFKLRTFAGNMLVLSDYESIYQVKL